MNNFLEENHTDDWKNERIKLDTALMSAPLNQAKLTIEKFSKDGKDLKTVFEDDFKKDENKKIAYQQLSELIF